MVNLGRRHRLQESLLRKLNIRFIFFSNAEDTNRFYVDLGFLTTRYGYVGTAVSLYPDTDPVYRNILFLPFRRTHTVSMSDAIKQYISTKYDQHPDMFTQDLETVDRIRTDAVNSLEAHTSGIKKLTAYAAQLVWMGGKFPIDVIDPLAYCM